MKSKTHLLIPSVAVSLALCLSLNSRADNPTDLGKQKKECEQQARPEVEQQRKEAEQKAEKALDKEAIAALEDTTKAIKAISDNKIDEALAAIERAAGKINILLARNPATALIPVAVQVEVVEAAPLDLHAIKARAKAAELAVEGKDYPAARVLLDGLTSEIRVRTSHLPLASYPAAMQEAARLLDQKMTKEANTILLTALNTLAVVDLVTPLPLALAQTAIQEAQTLREKDKDKAQKLLAVAKSELERAKALGYAGNDPAYAAMNTSISSIEKQLKGNENTASSFAKLKEMVASFFTKQSDSKRPS